MTEPKKTATVDKSRRRLLKSTALVGGALAAGRLSYSRPELQTFLGGGPAYAQSTPNFIIECSGEALADGPGPQLTNNGPTVCNDSEIVNIQVSVSPIPPAHTEIKCDPTTNDPNNLQGTGIIQGTDPHGNIAAADLSLTGDFPNPLIAFGSTLTLTFAFVDTDTFGMGTCELNFTVVSCLDDA